MFLLKGGRIHLKDTSNTSRIGVELPQNIKTKRKVYWIQGDFHYTFFMSGENPWAFSEANNRIREKVEREKMIIEETKEDFEKNKERIRKKKGLDVFQLKRKIETGQSLDVLKDAIKLAFHEGTISKDAFEKTMKTLDGDFKEKNSVYSPMPSGNIPFSQNEFARMLEEAKLWENILVDIAGIFYGFFVQGSAILVIIAWKILTDLLFLPRDILQEMKQ